MNTRTFAGEEPKPTKSFFRQIEDFKLRFITGHAQLLICFIQCFIHCSASGNDFTIHNKTSIPVAKHYSSSSV